MIKYHKTMDGRIREVEQYEKGCWVRCIDPNEAEINYIMKEFKIDVDLLKSSLDEEESTHIDTEGENTLIIIDSPVVDKTGNNFTYYTNPMSIILTSENIITIALRENSIMDEFAEGAIRSACPEDKVRFALQILFRTAVKYLQYLTQINKITQRVEEELKKNMKNEELIQLVEIEKSLVYFSASLKSVNGMLRKLSRGKYVKLNEEELDLLEDVILEIMQASEMSAIYLDILSTSMEAYSSLISNNLDVSMKYLASITLILSMPTIVSGIYGMNNPGIPLMESSWAPFILMVISVFITWIVLRHKKML